ncbi:hypothetical protein [Chitinophaga agri]|uniref:Uncharacterized protein n=1 Tax=Chitinophaga agri TaxID=2703787 RepID=A0A6B9Z884_9BACT|nr:hypothetical protein [Chitinophaga agri]QHS58452.1 hypothetical protein GWR21_02225 [Chitinophaga agri]
MISALDTIENKLTAYYPTPVDKLSLRLLLLDLCEFIATHIRPRSPTHETRALSQQYMKTFNLYLSVKTMQSDESMAGVKESALINIQLIRSIIHYDSKSCG